jgi:hypothetical protein
VPVGLDPQRGQAPIPCRERDAWIEELVRLHRAAIVRVVVGLLHGLRRRISAYELVVPSAHRGLLSDSPRHRAAARRRRRRLSMNEMSMSQPFADDRRIDVDRACLQTVARRVPAQWAGEEGRTRHLAAGGR